MQKPTTEEKDDSTPIVAQDDIRMPISWSDLKNFIRFEIENRNNYIFDLYKNYYMYSGDRSVELQKSDELWRSNMKSPITNMFATRLHNMIINADKKFSSTYAGNDLDKDQALRAVNDAVELMDYCFSKEETYGSFDFSSFDAGLIGRGVLKVGYKSNKKKRKYLKKGGIGYDTTEDNDEYPYAKYIPGYNFFADGGAYSVDRCRFIAERFFMSDDQINQMYSVYGINITKEISERLEKEKDIIDYKDYDAIKRNIPFYNSAEGRDITDDERFNVKNHLREVIEISTKNGMILYVNGVKLWAFYPIGPYDTYKYYIIGYKENPGVLYKLGIGTIVKPLQEMYDKITNLRLDNVLLAVNKVFITESDFNIMGNSKRMKLKPGDIYKVTDVNTFKTLEMGEIKESAYKETDVMFNLAQGTTGISNYGLGIQNKVERVAGATDMLQETLDGQAKPLVDSVKKTMGSIMKEFIILALVYMEKEKLDKILWDDNVLSSLNVQDIIDDFTFDFSIESNQKKMDTVQRQQLIDLLRLAPQLVDADGKPIIDMRDVVIKIWDSLDLDSSTILTPEEYQTIILSSEVFKNTLAQRVQEAMATGKIPQETTPKAGGDEWTVDGLKSGMRALQGLGNAGVPAEMTTNAAGVNA